MAERPNLLVILSDQHNPHVLGCAGDRVVRTPNLDRLIGRMLDALAGWDGDRIERAMAEQEARREAAFARAERFRTPGQDA